MPSIIAHNLLWNSNPHNLIFHNWREKKLVFITRTDNCIQRHSNLYESYLGQFLVQGKNLFSYMSSHPHFPCCFMLKCIAVKSHLRVIFAYDCHLYSTHEMKCNSWSVQLMQRCLWKEDVSLWYTARAFPEQNYCFQLPASGYVIHHRPNCRDCLTVAFHSVSGVLAFSFGQGQHPELQRLKHLLYCNVPSIVRFGRFLMTRNGQCNAFD